MRRVPLMLLAVGSLGGCSQISVGLWADSERGATSVATITSIDFPTDPAAPSETNADEPKAPKPLAFAKTRDRWTTPSHVNPAATGAGTSLGELKPAPGSSAEKETWTPSIHHEMNAAEFAADARDYRWVQGRVSLAKIDGAQVWKIRFAPYDQVDRYGGGFVLDGNVPPNLKEGDLVRIEGRPKAGSNEAKPVRYQCERLTILRRADGAKP